MTLRRTITHWTAGGSRASDLDRQHYHFIVEHDGKVVEGKHEPDDNIVTSDGDYAAHVLNLNAGSIGVAMAGMRGAVESPFDAGPSPLTEKQFEAHCLLLAELHRAHAIPVTRETCLTHAEVQPTLGVVQRGKWDITRLPFKPELRGALPVGDYLRERVKSYLQAGSGADPLPVPNAPYLRFGSKGDEVAVLQRDLARLGYFAGKIDGDFGRLTREAVLAFQAENGLETDGVAGPQTVSALLTRAKPRPLRDVTEADLADSGTIRDAGAVKTAAVGLGGAGVVTDLLDGANGIGASVAQAQGWIGTAQAILVNHWPVLVFIGGALALVYFADRIKARRIEDARTGAHLGR